MEIWRFEEKNDDKTKRISAYENGDQRKMNPEHCSVFTEHEPTKQIWLNIIINTHPTPRYIEYIFVYIFIYLFLSTVDCNPSGVNGID